MIVALQNTDFDNTTSGKIYKKEGYYTNPYPMKSAEYELGFTYKEVAFGFVPRALNNYFYMEIKCSNVNGEGRIETYIMEHENMSVLDTQKVPLFVKDQSYKMKVICTETSFAIFLGDVKVSHIEYPYLPVGFFAVYGEQGACLEFIDVYNEMPDGWSADVPADGYTLPGWYTATEVSVADKGKYWLSFDANASGSVEVEEHGTNTNSEYPFVVDKEGEYKRFYILVDVVGVGATLSVTWNLNSTILPAIYHPQLEKNIATSFIPTEDAKVLRDGSLLTFPSKSNIDMKEGTFSLYVKPKYAEQNFTIMECGKFHIYYESGKVVFQYGNTKVEKAMILNPDDWNHIVASWEKYEIALYLEETKTVIAKADILPEPITSIKIANGSKGILFGIVDDALITGYSMDARELFVLSNATEPHTPEGLILFRSNFDAMISNQRQDFIDITPSPKYGSPVIAEKEGNIPLRKVSFFDPMTGKYRSYNEEVIVYDGFSDYIEIAFDNIETESHEPYIVTLEDVRVGEPYTMKGRRIYMSLTPVEKKKLRNKMFKIVYQPKDSYTVDYNVNMFDTARVAFGKSEGVPITITQEGNRFQEEKLLTMIDLNPFATPQHEGFLYVTNNVEKVEGFRTHLTPDGIAADYSQSLFVVEPLDKYGNPITHAILDVTAEKGYIVPVYDRASLKMKEQGGRYLYHYYSPFLKKEDVGKKYISDTINIIDRETGIGAQEKIVLATSETVEHIITRFDTVELLCQKYGAAKEDIEKENKMKVKLEDYLLQNRGKRIQIPIIYRASELEVERAWIEQEVKIGNFVQVLSSFFKETELTMEEELFSIINVNGDGIIDYDDFSWIEEHKYDLGFQEKQRKLAEYMASKGGKL